MVLELFNELNQILIEEVETEKKMLEIKGVLDSIKNNNDLL